MDLKRILFGNYIYEKSSQDGKSKFILTIKGGLVGCLGSLLLAYGTLKLAVFLWDKFF